MIVVNHRFCVECKWGNASFEQNRLVSLFLDASFTLVSLLFLCCSEHSCWFFGWWCMDMKERKEIERWRRRTGPSPVRRNLSWHWFSFWVREPQVELQPMKHSKSSKGVLQAYFSRNRRLQIYFVFSGCVINSVTEAETR